MLYRNKASVGHTFAYDGLDRLTSATGPWGADAGAITYDARGNITGQSLGAFNTGLAYNATTGQLVSSYVAKDGIATTSYPTFNNAGHMTWDGKNQFFFNQLDQLVCAGCTSAGASTGSETRYGYDGLGMRIWSQKGSAAKVYEFHSRDNRLLMEWQPGAGGFTKEHIYAGQRRIAEVHTITGQAAKVTHSHPDPSGSPAMLSDASGLVSARENYRPYGDKLISPNTNESAGFANKAFDASTNLSYMSARYYNPTLGRFISPDPVHFVEGNIHSFNRYAYANNNPMKFVDPDGRLAVQALGFGVGFGIDVAAQIGSGMLGGKSFGEALGGVSVQTAAISGVASALTGGVAVHAAGKALEGAFSVGKAATQTGIAGGVTNGAGNVLDSKLNGESNATAATKGGIGVIGGFFGGFLGGVLGNKGASHLNGMAAKGGVPQGIEQTTRGSMVPGKTAVNPGAAAVAGSKAVDLGAATGSKNAESQVKD